MSLVESSLVFDEHRAMLIFEMGPVDNWKFSCTALLLETALKVSGQHAADAVRKIVVDYRPELAGCEIRFLNFNWDRHRFEIGVSHPSLPTCLRGAVAEELPLVQPETLPRMHDCTVQFGDGPPVQITGIEISRPLTPHLASHGNVNYISKQEAEEKFGGMDDDAPIEETTGIPNRTPDFRIAQDDLETLERILPQLMWTHCFD